MEDDNVDYSLETLRDFVSSSIFDFFSGDDESTAIVDLDDHERKPYVDVSYGRDPPPLDELDAHIDALLLECSKQFEEEQLEQHSSKHMKLDTSSKSSPCKRVFAAPKPYEEIAKTKLSAIPDKTISYSAGVWKQWCDHRLQAYIDRIPPLEQLSMSELASHLCNFVRKKNFH